MTTAAERLTRLLELLPRVAGGDWHSLEELRAEFDSDAEKLIEDLRAVAESAEDLPGLVEAVQIYLRADGVAVHTSHFLRPTRLTPREAAALELGLALLAAERPPDEWPPIESARRRLRSALTMAPPGEFRVAETVPFLAAAAPPAEPRILAVLRKAMRGRRVTEIDYHSGDAPAASSRRVHPYLLRSVRGGWYLWARDERSGERRLFRVDRVEEARMLEERFDRPADVGEHEFMREGRAFVGEPAATLKVRYSDRVARWIAEREPHTKVRGGIVVEYPLGDPAWAVRHVLQYGPEAEVLEPPELRDAVRTTLESLVRGARDRADRASR